MICKMHNFLCSLTLQMHKDTYYKLLTLHKKFMLAHLIWVWRKETATVQQSKDIWRLSTSINNIYGKTDLKSDWIKNNLTKLTMKHFLWIWNMHMHRCQLYNPFLISLKSKHQAILSAYQNTVKSNHISFPVFLSPN